VKVSVFLFIISSNLPVNSHNQHKLEADVSNLIFLPLSFPGRACLHILKKSLKSVVLKNIWMGKIIRQMLTYRVISCSSPERIIISQTSFMGTPNSMRILYNTSLTES
jgi:hypothetical protein